ncbi:FMN-dependent NADH-azoreductase [Enterococcus nangangensis]|uniref:FMN-dependent NADH-azoreductase n=1 Tax=Enterococcus nangangensis TaxID=2559926 RepID=UPI0010F8D7BF|nr:FMN-dependent NADH-azoreductase [Enterococcus nangangensis]
MSKVLVIKAHPLTEKESRTLKGLATFLENYRPLHPEDEVTVFDAFEDDLPEVNGELLSAWGALRAGTDFASLSSEQQHAVARFDELTEMFLQADKIIVANALWNLNIPTRLKAWIDTIMVAGKTFKYTPTGPQPLTTGKKVFHIQSNGGVYGGEDFANQYLKNIFAFVGVTDYAAAFIEGLDYDPEHAEELLEKALAEVAQAAKEF